MGKVKPCESSDHKECSTLNFACYVYEYMCQEVSLYPWEALHKRHNDEDNCFH